MKTKFQIRILPLFVSVFLTIILTGCTKPTEDEPNQSSTVTDNDGNTYKTITIGTQVWMTENLKATKYRNGDAIANDKASWSTTKGAYCWYDNNIKYKDLYGALYNWYAIKDNRIIAPLGWHVATDYDWTTLTTYLGGENVAGGKLKEKGLTHWGNPNTGASDQYGFGALPGGITYNGNFFDGLGVEGVWWSNITSTPTDYSNDWNRQMWFDEAAVSKTGYIFDLQRGKSVRCVKDNISLMATIPTVKIAALATISATSASLNCEVTSDGGSAVIARGICWSTSSLPTIADNKTVNGTGIGIFNSSITGLISKTIYYARAYATNKIGTAYEIPFKFTTLTLGMIGDIDGNIYKTVTIGTQIWMAENLKTTKYNDGTIIPNITGETAWAALATPAYCWYNNDYSINGTIYGALYNWYVVDPSNMNKIAPVGWHIPSDAEWTILTNYLGGLSLAGDKLRETGTSHWANPNNGSTNESGFTGLPGGIRYFAAISTGTFETLGRGSGYWSSTSDGSTSAAWCRQLMVNLPFYRGANTKRFGFSVRCIKD